MIDLDKGFYGKVYKVSLFLHVSFFIRAFLITYYVRALLAHIMILCLQNQSRSDRTVRVVMSSTSVFYTGVKAHLVKKGQGEFTLAPNESKTFILDRFGKWPRKELFC